MIRTIADFEYLWSQELEATQKVFKHLTDKSLNQVFTPDGRTLGRLAWHIITSIPEMISRTGLPLSEPDPGSPVPSTAKEIFTSYNKAAISLLEQIRANWTDATLNEQDEMYGQIWKRSRTLGVLIFHQIHHRGQMTILMRQAGLAVPGIYGPTREEWAQWGMKPPEV